MVKLLACVKLLLVYFTIELVNTKYVACLILVLFLVIIPYILYNFPAEIS